MPLAPTQPTPTPQPKLTRAQFAQIKLIESIYQDFKKQIDALKLEQDAIINQALDSIDHEHIQNVLKQIHQ